MTAGRWCIKKTGVYRARSGMPIYGKIRFLRIFIACFSQTKKLFMAESTDFFLLGSATTPPHCTFEIAVFYGKKIFLDESTYFFVLNSATTPLPPTLDSRYFARAE